MRAIPRAIPRAVRGIFASGGTPSFDPASLFGDSDDGHAYNLANLSTVWEDSAGTTPASIDGPVGRVDDVSGKGNNATQGTADNRPLISVVGGKNVLVFDTTNDSIVSAVSVGPSSKWTFAMSFSLGADTQAMLFPHSANTSYYVGAAQSGSSSTGLSGGSVIDKIVVDGSVIAAANRGELYTAVSGGNPSIIVELTTTSGWNVSPSLAYFAASSTWNWPGNISRHLVIDRALTDDEIAALTGWLNG